jgi:hypothetical protein
MIFGATALPPCRWSLTTEQSEIQRCPFCTFSWPPVNAERSRFLCITSRLFTRWLSLSTSDDRVKAVEPAQCNKHRTPLLDAGGSGYIKGTRFQTALRRYTFALTQSSLAIISSLVMGVKLSRSMPRAAIAARACAGTSFELRCGAIESSKLVLESACNNKRHMDFGAYRGE